MKLLVKQTVLVVVLGGVRAHVQRSHEEEKNVCVLSKNKSNHRLRGIRNLVKKVSRDQKQYRILTIARLSHTVNEEKAEEKEEGEERKGKQKKQYKNNTKQILTKLDSMVIPIWQHQKTIL